MLGTTLIILVIYLVQNYIRKKKILPNISNIFPAILTNYSYIECTVGTRM